MAEDTSTTEAYAYSDLLTEIIKSMPKNVTLNSIKKKTLEKLDTIEDPSIYRKYLESVIFDNLSSFFFETDDEGNELIEDTNEPNKEAALMSTYTLDTKQELLLAAATAIDKGDLGIARFLIKAADSTSLEEDEREELPFINEYREEIENSPYKRLPMMVDRDFEFAVTSWLRITVDKAGYDPNWIKYSRLHKAKRVGPITWDFPMFPQEDVQDVLRTIKEETSYSPRWYEQLDYRVDGKRDIPANMF